MAGNPRVLFVLNDAGNALTHRRPLLDMFLAAGFDVHVAAPTGPAFRQLAVLGVQVHDLALVRRSVSPMHDLRTVLALRRILRKVRPDLVQSATLKAVVAAGLANRRGRVPAVHLVTGLGSFFTSARPRGSSWAMRLLAFATGGRHQRIVVQNRDDFEVLQRHGVGRPGRLRLVRGSGVDVERFTPAEARHPPEVVLAARMLRSKGVEAFVEAARALKPRFPQVRFRLVGDPDPGNRDTIEERRLLQWASEGDVTWGRHTPHVAELLAGASVVCLPTTYGEGIPKVLLEAASAGVPLVATDMPGCREVVRPGVNGLLVPPGSGSGLAQALAQLLSDPALRRTMGARSRELAVAEFRTEVVLEAMRGIYAELGVWPPRLGARAS